MSCKSHKKIVICGMSVLRIDQQGNYYTRNAILNYIVEFLDYFDEVVFIAPLQEEGVEKTFFGQGLLEKPKLRVIPISLKKIYYMKNWFLFIRESRNAYVILHMPTALHLFPIIYFINRVSVSSCIYIGNDYFSYWKNFGHQKSVLWRFFYLYAHEYPAKIVDFVICRGVSLKNRMALINKKSYQTVPVSNSFALSNELVSVAYIKNESILFIGKVVWDKGLKYLIDGFKSFCEIVYQANCEKKWKLEIVGYGADFEQVRSYVQSLNLEDAIIFHGYIDEKSKLEQIWKRAMVLVMPSHHHPEGVPRVIDEALSYGVPVIATKVGGVLEEFADGEVYLIKPADSLAIRDALERICQDEKFSEEMVYKGKLRMKKWLEHKSACHQHTTLLLRCARRY